MKCEMCHKNDAECAMQITRDGVEDELYVCSVCEREERLRRQKNSQRTRKKLMLPPGVSMSVTQIGEGEAPPQIIEALMNAVQGVVSGMGKEPPAAPSTGSREMFDVPLDGVDGSFVLAGALQLEGLFLIGEIEAVKRSLRALDMDMAGYAINGIIDSGHVYVLKRACDAAKARRIRDRIVAQEHTARLRLMNEMPRVFGDALCRALAILKNARLLSSGELFDLLSPLRLAASGGYIEGITPETLETLIASIDIFNKDETLDQRSRDKIDAGLADEMNRRFEDVVLNEEAEDKFL